MRHLFKFQAQRAEHYYQQAYTYLDKQDRFQQRSGLIMAAIYHALLERIEKQNFDVFTRPVRLSPLRKLWIAWRTSRKELKANKK